jgi:hypothetical protein
MGILAVYSTIGAYGQERHDAGHDESSVILRFVAWKADHPHAWDNAFAQFSGRHPHISIVRELTPHSSTAYHDLLTQS